MQFITASFRYHLWKREIIQSKHLRSFSNFASYSNKLPPIKRIPKDEIQHREFSITQGYGLTNPFDRYFFGKNTQFMRKEGFSKLDASFNAVSPFSSDSFFYDYEDNNDLVVSIVGPPNAGKEEFL